MPAPAQSSYIQNGQQVQSLDLNSLSEAASEMAGAAVTAIIGVADANTAVNPITVIPGAGMSVVVGALGEAVLVQSRLADYLPSKTVAIAAASAATRYDLIAFAFADVIVPTGTTTNFMDLGGNIAPQPTAYVYRGIQTTVVTGTPGGALPAAPSGFDPLAQVHVAAGATHIAAGDITLLLPTMQSLLTALAGGGGVASIGSVDNSIIVTTNGRHVNLAAAVLPNVLHANFAAVNYNTGITQSVDLTLAPGNWTVAGEASCWNVIGDLTMQFAGSDPGHNSGTSTGINGALYQYIYKLGIVVPAGTTLTETVQVTCASTAPSSNGVLKILAYPTG